ncbi:MAG: hypothetical protein ACFFCW_32275 [Candidatus Hodarchaeota archaeon]
MVVSLPESGDAIYNKENIEKNIPAGNCWDPGQAVVSMHRLLHIAKREKGQLFITHDPDAWNTLKPSPLLLSVNFGHRLHIAGPSKA